MAMARGSGPCDSKRVMDPRIEGAGRQRMGLETLLYVDVGRTMWLAAAREPARACELDTDGKEMLGAVTTGWRGGQETSRDTRALTIFKLRINEATRRASWSVASK